MTDEPRDTPTPPLADLVWNSGDLPCGELILELQSRVSALPTGGVIRLHTEDAGAPHDIPAWCRLTGNTLVLAVPPDFWIRRDPRDA